MSPNYPKPPRRRRKPLLDPNLPGIPLPPGSPGVPKPRKPKPGDPKFPPQPPRRFLDDEESLNDLTDDLEPESLKLQELDCS